MTEDIVTRLREQAQAPALAWLNDAAAEIERLRAEGDALVGCIKMQMWETLHLMMDKWEEERRG